LAYAIAFCFDLNSVAGIGVAAAAIVDEVT
jgi:hypothetical protein